MTWLRTSSYLFAGKVLSAWNRVQDVDLKHKDVKKRLGKTLQGAQVIDRSGNFRLQSICIKDLDTTQEEVEQAVWRGVGDAVLM